MPHHQPLQWNQIHWLFDPNKALSPMDEKFNWKAVEANSPMDNPAQLVKDSGEFDG